MATLLFAGGLDTVASELSYITHHLARHPEQQRRLREEPEIIPAVREEFLRRFGLSNTGRILTRDFEYKGVLRSEEHTSELQSLMRISYAVFCLKKKNTNTTNL